MPRTLVSGSQTDFFIDITALELEIHADEMMAQAEIEAKTFKSLYGGTDAEAWQHVMDDVATFDDPSYNGMFKGIKTNIQRTIREQTKNMVAKPVEELGKDKQQMFFWELGIVKSDHCGDCYLHSRQGAKTKEDWMALGKGLPRWGMTQCNIGCRCMLRPAEKGKGTTKETAKGKAKGIKQAGKTGDAGKALNKKLKNSPVSERAMKKAQADFKRLQKEAQAKAKSESKINPILKENMAGKHTSRKDAMAWAKHQAKQGKHQYMKPPTIKDMPPRFQELHKISPTKWSWEDRRYYQSQVSNMQNHRFSGNKVDQYGVFAYDKGKLTLEDCNSLNLWLKEANTWCDNMGIPRLRGVDHRTGKAHAWMGDGVLGISKKTFDYFGNHRKNTAKNHPYMSAEQIDRHFEKSLGISFKDIHFDKNGNALPDWKFTGANKKNPHGAQAYLITRKKVGGEWRYSVNHTLQAEMTFWHEMGHHIHQQKGNLTWADYRGMQHGGSGFGTMDRTPMEIKVYDLYQKLATSKGGIINDGNRQQIYPSQYSYKNFKEWWAENHSMYRMGFKVHPLLEKFYIEEGIY